MTYQARMIAGGKLVIPADLRRELGIETGDSILLDRDSEGHIVLKTREQIVREVQATFRALRGRATGASVVDELLAERREAARRDDAKTDEWMATTR